MPYQLHCSPETIGALLLERELLVVTGGTLDTEELLAGGVVPEQMLPVNVGTSPEPPRLST